VHMKKFNGRLATVVIGIAAAFGAPQMVHAADAGKVRMVVQFKDAAGAKAAIAAAGGKIVLDVSELNAYAVVLPKAAIAKLQRNAHIASVDADPDRHMFGLADPSGPPYQAGQLVPYGIHMVQADQLPLGDAFASDRTLCIVDSGIDGVHEDLNGIPVTGENLTTSGSWNTDEAHHGTHVAGTIAAINNSGVGVVGINPNKHLNIRIEKVFDASGSAPSSTIAKAMLACGKNGANVVSMSLGGSGSSPLENLAVKVLDKKGILQIAAAGNAGNSTISFPAGFDQVVSVAALDINKAWATFSQFNADVEIAGPGVTVLSTVPMGTGLTGSVTTPSVSIGDILPMAFSPSGTVTAPLYNYGTGEVADPGAAGKVCLIQRGNISFSDKVAHCAADGGVGAVIYNNVPGALNGTLGAPGAIIAVGASDTEGATLLTQVGQPTTVTVVAGNYAYFDGTSMATPHVSGVAALVWSYFPSCTAAQIRTSLNNSAQDLGDPGRDVKFGYGLVQAKAAYDRIRTMGCGV